MASPNIDTLKTLLQHYEQLREAAALGKWENIDREAPKIAELFSRLENTVSTIKSQDKAEASALIKRILEANATVQLHASSWLQDVAPLLKVLNRQP